MLPRATYLKTLAELGDARSPEWHITVAGLVVLRLVDDWLDFGPSILSEDGSDLQAIQTLIAQIPNAYLIQSLLTQVISSISSSEHASVQAVRPSLLAYAKSLAYTGKITLAQDVLIPLRLQAESRKDATSIVPIAHLSAGLFRKSGMFDLAMEQYAIADYYAKIIGDPVTPLYVREGQSYVLAAQGDIGSADDMCADVITRANRTANSRLLSSALHNRAIAAFMNNDSNRSLQLLYRALEFTHEGRDTIRVDMAAVYLTLGNIQASRQITTQLAITSQNQYTRCQATILLMHSATLLHDEQLFDLYRHGLALMPMAPWSEFYFREWLALGYRTFGRLIAAEEELGKHRALAAQHGFRIAES